MNCPFCFCPCIVSRFSDGTGHYTLTVCPRCSAESDPPGEAAPLLADDHQGADQLPRDGWRYYPGYAASVARVQDMGFGELLKLCDDLYGRPDGWETYTLDRLREEALHQHASDWRVPDWYSPEGGAL